MADTNATVLAKAVSLLYKIHGHDVFCKKDLWKTLCLYIRTQAEASKNMSVGQVCQLIKQLHEQCSPHNPVNPFMRVAPGGMLSLHIAAAIRCPLRLMQLIVKLAPQTLCTLDHKGMRPLHWFCEKGHQGPASESKCLEKMRFLHEGTLDAVATVDSDGYSPLHLLVVCNASALLVQDCVT